MGLHDNFVLFCGSEFWDENLTWTPTNSTPPDITPCMESVGLVWIPCVVLWVGLLPSLMYLNVMSSLRIPQAITAISAVKSLLPLCIVMVSIYQLVTAQLSAIHIMTFAILTMSMIMSSALVQIYRRKGQYTSALLWTFWFFAMIANLVECYVHVKRYLWMQAHEDRNIMIAVCVQASIYVIGFILSCFTDAGTEATKRYKDSSPEMICSFPTFITFHWMQPIMSKGYQKHKEGLGLGPEDLYKLTPEDSSKAYYPPFEKDLYKSIQKYRASQKSDIDDEMSSSTGSYESFSESTPLLSSDSSEVQVKKTKHGLSLVKPVLKHWLPLLMASWGVRGFGELVSFVNPVIQGLLISFVGSQATNTPEPFWRGLLYCLALFGGNTFLPLAWGLEGWLTRKVFLQMESSLMIAIYKKSLTMSGQAKQQSDTGEIVNHMGLDAARVAQLCNEAHVYVYVSIQTGLSLYLLHGLVGNSVFAGLTVLLITSPVTVLMCKYAHRYGNATMKSKDERVKIINEALSAIKVIKLYAWEPPFISKIGNLREKELAVLKKQNILRAGFQALWRAVPTLITLIVFTLYTATQPDHYLTPTVAFVSLSLFDKMKDGLNHLPHSIAYCIECSVSLKRLVKYFQTEDVEDGNVILDLSAANAVEITDGTFTHVRDKKPILRDINMKVRPGSLTGIVGTVGCGKSSLLSSLIGDLHKVDGSVKVKGTMALVAQQAFILNDTVRENILFGSKYNKTKYDNIVEACALKADFNILPKGDKSQIGEKVDRSRELVWPEPYNDADIYLLDDPLSAVDAHVGKHIFDHVTHGIHWLPLLDEVYVLKSNRVAEHGSYEALLSHNGEFAEFVREYFLNENKSTSNSDGEEEQPAELQKQILQRLESITSVTSADSDIVDEVAGGRHAPQHTESELPTEPAKSDLEDGDEGTNEDTSNVFDDQEELQTQKISWRTFMLYIKAQGAVNAIVIIVAILFRWGLNLAESLWITKWTSDDILSPTSNASDSTKQSASNMYIGGLAGIGLSQIVMVMASVTISAHAMYIASKQVHTHLLSKILKATMTFFDTKPLGMILNRFSKDIDIVDKAMGWILNRFYNTVLSVVVAFAGIIYVTPYMAIPIIPLVALYFAVQKYFIPTARQTRRHKSKLNSPIYAHFSETLNGVQTIRAYRHQERFIAQNAKHLEAFNVFSYFERFQNSWLDVRMGMISATLVFSTATFCVIATQIEGLSGTITGSLTGLILSLVFRITGMLEGMVWVVAHAETNAVSVERIREYTEVEQEADWSSDQTPDSDWPETGVVKFNHYATRYRDGLDLVVKDFDIAIKPQEKIGIVGRTGAGKSSLTLSLFRLIEAVEGNIVIDGVNIADIGLHELRNSITILPQDPVLFSGSIRENLDPFSRSNDDKIWQVLEQCQLKQFVQEQTGGLSADCGEGGENLSVGQRQLVCLARALLRKTKILILDEATAAVDLKTDDFIQKTIQREFCKCTILTIAHRLNTIIDYNRILVMDKGRVVEFDSPANLLKDTSGIFYSMAQQSGLI